MPPVATCQNLTVQLDADGNASIAEDAVNNGSTDACGIASIDTDVTDFTCADVGANTVTLTITDVNNNSSTCTATVTVEDNVPPVAICQNITVQLDANGNATIAEDAVNNGSTDACGIASYDTDITNFTCADKGDVTVTLTVTDVNGNASTCTAMVTVEDNIAPTVATCPNAITVNNDVGVCGAVATYAMPTFNDNCDGTNLTGNRTSGLLSGEVFPVGVTTVTHEYVDASEMDQQYVLSLLR